MSRTRTFVAAALLAGAFLAIGGSAPVPPPKRPSEKLVLALLNPERAAVVDLRSRKLATRTLPGGTLCHGPLMVTGGRLVLAGSRHRRAVALSIGLGLKGRARVVARADSLVPSAVDGRIWIGRQPSGRVLGPLRSVREVSLDGRTVTASRHPTPSPYVNGAVEDGLIFERRGRLQVWDPRQGVVVRRLPGDFVLATRGHQVATCSSQGCTRLNVVGRGQQEVFAPGYEFSENGAFSPDGRLLAVPARRGGHTYIVLVDLDSRAVRAVPGARMGDYAPLAWSRSGRWLYFVGASGRLMSYVPGAASSKWLRIRFHNTVMELASG